MLPAGELVFSRRTLIPNQSPYVESEEMDGTQSASGTEREANTKKDNIRQVIYRMCNDSPPILKDTGEKRGKSNIYVAANHADPITAVTDNTDKALPRDAPILILANKQVR